MSPAFGALGVHDNAFCRDPQDGWGWLGMVGVGGDGWRRHAHMEDEKELQEEAEVVD